jgi:hypothetical protein
MPIAGGAALGRGAAGNEPRGRPGLAHPAPRPPWAGPRQPGAAQSALFVAALRNTPVSQGLSELPGLGQPPQGGPALWGVHAFEPLELALHLGTDDGTAADLLAADGLDAHGRLESFDRFDQDLFLLAAVLAGARVQPSNRGGGWLGTGEVGSGPVVAFHAPVLPLCNRWPQSRTDIPFGGSGGPSAKRRVFRHATEVGCGGVIRSATGWLEPFTHGAGPGWCRFPRLQSWTCPVPAGPDSGRRGGGRVRTLPSACRWANRI